MDEALANIPNFRRINDRVITAGQPSEDQLRAVAAAGFEVVINLAPHEDPRSLPDEAGLVESLGLTYINIPVPFSSPTRGQLDAFFAAMEDHAERRLLVHCLANKRVTAFLGLYFVLRRGESFDAAFAPMRDVWKPNEAWAAFVEGILNRPSAISTIPQ